MRHDPLLRPTRRRDDLPHLRDHADAVPVLPCVAAPMKHILEMLIVVTIGSYCLYRMYCLMPLVISEAQDLVSTYLLRVDELENIIENIE